MIDQVTEELEGASHVEEWLGPNRRLPVFDVESLREYGRDEANCDRLAHLLASYVRVASGSVWERSRGRWRRRRYSELDLVDLAELGAFSRLGDLALFLSGVFPEYVARRPIQPHELERLAHLLARRSPAELGRAQEPFWLLEWLGQNAYGRAGEVESAKAFRTARRFLNVLTGRHLFPVRLHWFPEPPGR